MYVRDEKKANVLSPLVFLSFQKGLEKEHVQSEFYSVLLKFQRNKRM